jgi:hypothetical protein
MSSLGQELARWKREHPTRLLSLGGAIVVLAASGWVGAKSRAATLSLAAKQAAWRSSAEQLATVTQQFRTPSSSETASLLAESGRVTALGVQPADRVSLMELVARAADASMLTDVHVTFRTGIDSVLIAPRIIGGSTISPASYGIVIDCSGSFAGVVQFVSSLPPSVSVSRLSASRHGDRATYHVLLSVYELPNGDSAS